VLDRRLRLESAAAVRSLVARVILAEVPREARVGSISLKPHQISAVARLCAALDQFNGALLCDDVGMGKTYVATAIAQRFTRCLIVAPAALLPMWRDALSATDTVADIVTFEALSRADIDHSHGRRAAEIRREGYDLIIVDEAHHVRSRTTNRYFSLASLVRGAQVLLLTATPIHNRRADLVALLSLFLGSRARTMTTAELGLCIVRRAHAQLDEASSIPEVAPMVHHQVTDDEKVVAELMNLPPPLPFRDGGLGGVLIGRGLVHQWASSEAALHEAIRRRIARAMALRASLEAGAYPSAKDLESWVYGEGTLQLGFPELLPVSHGDNASFLAAVTAHLEALQEFLSWFRPATALDARRAAIVAEIRSLHPGSKIVAFAQYSETVSTLFRRMVAGGRVAMLTSHGARVAGGAIARDEAIARFAPRASRAAPPPAAEAIDLLLTTDLLSEGVNLQDAGVVVHLDMPWTVARMEQRVGRVARMGSQHSRVHVHVLHPPRSAIRVLDTEAIVQRKWNVARTSVGISAPHPLAKTMSEDGVASESTPAKVERLRTILQSWMTADSAESDEMILAAIRASSCGFLAAIAMCGQSQLLVQLGGEITNDIDGQLQACLAVGDNELPADLVEAEKAVRAIESWCTRQRASAVAGVGGGAGTSSAIPRKQIISRIDLAIQTAPPHLRSVRSTTGARARLVATTQQCAAIEAELDALFHSDLPTDKWLEAVAALDSHRADSVRAAATAPGVRIRALLLMNAD
jgi:superfamily II DNA or RNA helicase